VGIRVKGEKNNMSKIAFTKLGLKRNDEIKVVEWNG